MARHEKNGNHDLCIKTSTVPGGRLPADTIVVRQPRKKSAKPLR